MKVIFCINSEMYVHLFQIFNLIVLRAKILSIMPVQNFEQSMQFIYKRCQRHKKLNLLFWHIYFTKLIEYILFS
jgi:hypothetical protein